jgi:hypothetical protein
MSEKSCGNTYKFREEETYKMGEFNCTEFQNTWCHIALKWLGTRFCAGNLLT